MKLYKRIDFLKLPKGTVYSKISDIEEVLMVGLYCKTTDEEYENDWCEQDLIAEAYAPDEITEGILIYEYAANLRDSFKYFETTLDMDGRDGFFDDTNKFVVWDKNDVTKLVEYLSECLKIAYT